MTRPHDLRIGRKLLQIDPTGLPELLQQPRTLHKSQKVDILRFTAFQDAGKAIHPIYVEGQIQGGSAQGIGWALNEEYFYDDTGDLKNSSFLDYRMPTSLDLPMIDTVIIENANPGHPFGVRGVGEANIVPPPAAIANAIFNSADVRMDVLPMSPMAVLDSIIQNI